MKSIITSLFFYFVIFLQPVLADLTNDSEYIMDKAEQLYPGIFPSEQVTQLLESYRYRYYPSTGVYLGINQSNSAVYLLGGVFGDNIYFLDQIKGVLTLLRYQESINDRIGITHFSFLKKNNPRLSADIQLDIVNNKITGSVPFNVSLDSLVATFGFNGANVNIVGINQKSGVSKNNYKRIISYRVIAEDGAARQYEVDIARFTGLPLVFITTENEAFIDSRDDYRKGNVKIIGGRGYDNLETTMKIRARGNSTWFHSPKKSYQMKLSDKAEILGMPADKKWLFLAEYFDKTMLRNKTAFELGRLSHLNWTPLSVYAEVFVNNQHTGTYHITQKVEESAHRINIGKNGYLLEIDALNRVDADDVYFDSPRFTIKINEPKVFNIKEPKVKKGDDKYRYISDYIVEFEKALYSSDFTHPEKGYAKYIEVDSFIDWYLINEISKNVDAQNFSSIFMNLIPGQKLKMGPIWDFDLSFGNMDYADPEFPVGFWVKDNPWISRLFDDPLFVNKVRERFAFYRANEAHIAGIVDQYAKKLERSQHENDQIWKTMGVYVWSNPVWFSTYALEVEHFKGWLARRMDWLEGAYRKL